MSEHPNPHKYSLISIAVGLFALGFFIGHANGTVNGHNQASIECISQQLDKITVKLKDAIKEPQDGER